MLKPNRIFGASFKPTPQPDKKLFVVPRAGLIEAPNAHRMIEVEGWRVNVFQYLPVLWCTFRQRRLSFGFAEGAFSCNRAGMVNAFRGFLISRINRQCVERKQGCAVDCKPGTQKLWEAVRPISPTTR